MSTILTSNRAVTWGCHAPLTLRSATKISVGGWKALPSLTRGSFTVWNHYDGGKIIKTISNLVSVDNKATQSTVKSLWGSEYLTTIITVWGELEKGFHIPQKQCIMELNGREVKTILQKWSGSEPSRQWYLVPRQKLLGYRVRVLNNLREYLIVRCK